MKVLVTGATGYVGGRLVPRLMPRKDLSLRLLVRDATRIARRGWDGLEIVEGDVTRRTDCERALAGVDVAYYLVHSMAIGAARFSIVDREAATQFSEVAREARVQRIIYLGGLAAETDRLSDHLKSRLETGDCLRASGIPVTEFRASIIIGSGSLSFEMLRYLTERLPIMICPRWVSTKAQPIAIRDVLLYLVETLDRPESSGRTFEIGGRDLLSYGEMMKIYAAKRGLSRWIIDVPVLTPRLSSYWVNLVTPLPASIARPLIEGVKNESIVRDTSALTAFSVQPLSFHEALSEALDRTFADHVETHWNSALSSVGPSVPVAAKLDLLSKPALDWIPVLESKEGLLIEKRVKKSVASPQALFQVLTGLGGENGWPYAHWLWELRGWMDRAIGGVGLRRGRRTLRELRPGDALDFWRVEAVEENRLLRLRAEMKVPGEAWLEFTLASLGRETVLLQRAIFEPKGLLGILYWYALFPIHGIIFEGMIREIVRKAERAEPFAKPGRDGVN